jgi:hypothetical protein
MKAEQAEALSSLLSFLSLISHLSPEASAGSSDQCCPSPISCIGHEVFLCEFRTQYMAPLLMPLPDSDFDPTEKRMYGSRRNVSSGELER